MLLCLFSAEYVEEAIRGLALSVSIERLSEEPYASIICYPRSKRRELKKRLKELRKLSVVKLEFIGEKQTFNVSILGKGCVGIVTIAYRNGEKAALKIRRVDADRASMQMEANMLKKANSVSVGPKLLGVSQDFLLMQFIQGDLFPQWLKKQRSKGKIRRALREVLEQCWRLDKAGLDHGELSHAPKHIIVNIENLPTIVDFETASLNRKPSNVTSTCQFLFINGTVAQNVAERLGEKNKSMIKVLRDYKRNRTRENFERVLKVCSL